MTAPAPLLERLTDKGYQPRPPLRRHRARSLRPWLWLLAGLVGLALLVVAVGSASTIGGASTASKAGMAPGRGGPGGQPQLGASSGAGAEVGRADAVGTTGAVAPSAAAAASPVAPASVSAEKVVKTGQVELVTATGSVAATLTAVTQAAQANAGTVSGSSTQEFGSAPSGLVTIRVPVDRFDTLLLRVRSLGAKVHSASTSASDVTGQSVDLDAQARTLRETRDQLVDIKRKATDVTDILTVQQRIDDINGRLNQIEGQLAVLQDQAAMSTLTVTVRQSGDPVYGPPAPAGTGLGQAFRDARHSFAAGVAAIVRHSGTAVLLAVCLLLLTPVALFVRRVLRRRSNSVTGPAADAGPTPDPAG